VKNIWLKELRVRVKKIKQAVIRCVEDVEDIHTIVKKEFVRIVGMEKLLNFVNPRLEIDVIHLMEIKDFIDRIFLTLIHLFLI
jgi:hypothetical protein